MQVGTYNEAMIRSSRNTMENQPADQVPAPTTAIEHEWHKFDDDYLIFALLTPENRKHARRAFYSGGWATHNRILKEIASGRSAEEVADWMQSLQQEFMNYGNAVVEGTE